MRAVKLLRGRWGSKGRPGAAKSSLRAAQERPRPPQDAPRPPQDEPIPPQDDPRPPQDATKTAKISRWPKIGASGPKKGPRPAKMNMFTQNADFAKSIETLKEKH